MKTIQQRRLMRVIHLIGAAAIGTYIYAPWREIGWFTLLMQCLVLPSLTLTGLWMWKGHKIRKKTAITSPRRSGNVLTSVSDIP